MNNVLELRKPDPEMAFDQFWSVYPRKKGKGAARKAFARIRWTPDLWTRLMTALEWQTREWSDPRFIPHPATYLNQERWDDEPDVAPEPCAWTGCDKMGSQEFRNGKRYCQNHIAALARGETPVGR